MNAALQPTPYGLYCPPGDFYIDPRRPVARAVITHAHADHARSGSRAYLCAREGRAILQARLGANARIETLSYGEVVHRNGVALSLHPAGHIRGSAQVKIVHRGHISVISGDYKTAPDPTCTPLEPQRCHTFISESTFGLPIFKWPSVEAVMAAINAWWRENRDQGRTSILFAYALGKAQRLLAGLDASIGPILTHGAVERINRIYRREGVRLAESRYIDDLEDREMRRKALVIAPPSADNPLWMRRFPHRSRAFASGWMRIRGNRRRRSVDRGFVLSDHGDWDALVSTIEASGAEAIGITHGYAAEMVRWLNERGRQALIVSSADANAPQAEGK